VPKPLGKSGNLESLQLDVVYEDDVLKFIDGCHEGRNFPILADEAAHHKQRKDFGRQILSRWSSGSFGPADKPRLVAHALGRVPPQQIGKFRKLLAPMIREADKYGWTVDQILREPGRKVYRGRRVWDVEYPMVEVGIPHHVERASEW